MTDFIRAAAGSPAFHAPLTQPFSPTPPGSERVAGETLATKAFNPAAVLESSTRAEAAKAAPQANNPVVNAEAALKQLREFFKALPREIQFSEDKDSGRTVFKVVNPTTGEVIRQFPPEELLILARRLKDLQKQAAGVLLDEEM